MLASAVPLQPIKSISPNLGILPQDSIAKIMGYLPWKSAFNLASAHPAPGKTLSGKSLNSLKFHNARLDADESGALAFWLKIPIDHPLKKTYMNEILENPTIDFRKASEWGLKNPMVHAVLMENTNLVEKLLKKGCLVTNDVFVEAFRYQKFNMIKHLLEKYPSLRNEELTTEAARNGNEEIFRLLLANPKLDASYLLDDAFQEASNHGNFNILKLILADSRVDPTIWDNSLIIDAAENDNIELVRLLLTDPRVDPSDQFNLAIQYAAENDNIELVRLLLKDPRVDPSDQVNTALISAAGFGNDDVVKLLLADPRVDPSDGKNTAIIQAARNGRLEIVKLLLKDPRVNPFDQSNRAIMFAAEEGYDDIVRLLLADPRMDANDKAAITASGII